MDRVGHWASQSPDVSDDHLLPHPQGLADDVADGVAQHEDVLWSWGRDPVEQHRVFPLPRELLDLEHQVHRQSLQVGDSRAEVEDDLHGWSHLLRPEEPDLVVALPRHLPHLLVEADGFLVHVCPDTSDLVVSVMLGRVQLQIFVS